MHPFVPVAQLAACVVDIVEARHVGREWHAVGVVEHVKGAAWRVLLHAQNGSLAELRCVVVYYYDVLTHGINIDFGPTPAEAVARLAQQVCLPRASRLPLPLAPVLPRCSKLCHR